MFRGEEGSASVKPFTELTAKGQTDRLRAFAPKAVRSFGVEPKRISILNHGYNTTFKVLDQNGDRYALRMNLDSGHDRRGIRAELQWVRALNEANLDFDVPRAVKDDIYTFHAPGREKEVDCVLYRWIDGPNVGKVANPHACYATGVALKQLHDQALSFKFEGQATVKEMPDNLWGTPFRLTDEQIDTKPLKITLERGEAVMDELRRAEPARLIHGDVHFGNTKWRRNRLAIFDFDDCIYAWPESDLAITIFHMRGHPKAPELEAALREGYGSFRIEEEKMEALIACRGVMLVNELSGSTNAAIQALVPAFFKKIEARLKTYVETGIYAAPAT